MQFFRHQASGTNPTLYQYRNSGYLALLSMDTIPDAYMDEYAAFVFCPEGTAKMQENAVSKISRAKVFLKYLTLGWSTTLYWNWEFLFNIPLLKSYPAILRRVGLAPTTVILYVGQAISFMEYFRATPPKHSRITTGQTKVVIRELQKLNKDLGRTVLGHQSLVKQNKGLKLVPKEDLARCQCLARKKIPSLLEDIEKAPARDPRTRYRFFGYLAAYLSSIYGHRTGVLTRMRLREVKEAIGNDETGYLINVMEHKTVRKFGTAQIYLEASEYQWFRDWIRLRSSYPAILRRVGLAPTTVILYAGQAISFMEYFRATPLKHSRITTGQTKVVIRELQKLNKDLGRTVLGHQSLVKQNKGLKLVPKEDLARCQCLARQKIPLTLISEDIEKVPARDPRIRYRFFGYLAAYLSSIYGHRTGVLTRMRLREVKEAIGNEEKGYLINVMEHKTVRKFGTAQIYLEASEYQWFRDWIRLRSRCVAKNGYFFSSFGRGEAKNMNFESNDAEVRQNLSSFMCHSAETQERFYALHKNLKLPLLPPQHLLPPHLRRKRWRRKSKQVESM
ncbi:uncharacterized protein LOC122760004 [Scomber scombrus]|uniref:Uncharacterized protein LOC122760004 n=1 Tax=Scomber scombrus TaxID=13677 RepID=A0AAV1P1Q7_SCOSC